MPGIQSELQCVPPLDLGRFQGPCRLCPCTYITLTGSHGCTHAPDIRDGNHRRAPGSTLTCSCTGPPVNFSGSPAAFSAVVFPFAYPIRYPLRKTSEDRSSKLPFDPVSLLLFRSFSFPCFLSLFFIFRRSNL